MNHIADIGDDEISVIGQPAPDNNKKKRKRRLLLIIGGVCAVLVVVVMLFLLIGKGKGEPDNPPDGNGNEETEIITEDGSVNEVWLSNCDTTGRAHVTRCDTVVRDMHLTLLTPYNAVPELSVGRLNPNDRSIVLAVQAADIRRDNGGIVGAFVLKGEPLAWSLSKKGYCAIIDGLMSIGVADDSPLFERATEKGGYFFRQFPLVDRGKPCESTLENRAGRRALCAIDGKVVVVLCIDNVLMNDFAKALASLGASNAIYLVGGMAHGVYRDETDGTQRELGQEWSRRMRNVNYLIFRN